MAMIQCPECQGEVSSAALKCPKCGFQINKPRRSFIGKIFKWLFILYNLMMIIWIFGGISATQKLHSAATSSAEQAGVALGTGLGVTMILVFWGIGAVILGLFVILTRPKV